MITKQYHRALAKTGHGGQTLYDHTFQCIEVGLRLVQFVPDYPDPALDTLVLSLCIHDVGKLDPTFQTMLQTRLKGGEYKGKLVKHEGHSLDHDHVPLVENWDIDRFIRNDGLEWAWAAAVNHHGLFYLSYEEDETGHMQRRARRQWTSYMPLEVRRLTLVDFLFHFHPLGGLVIMADQIASYAFDKGYDLETIFTNVSNLPAVFNQLLQIADETEKSMKRDDPRDYQLRDMLLLLAGSLA
jgi:hypothetical protein